jgi:hypothetical protein
VSLSLTLTERIVMKKFFLLMSLLVSSLSFANVLVLEEESVPGLLHASASFAVNRELGRAWVSLKMSEHPTMRRPIPRMIESRTLVSGLTYDQASSSILYSGKSDAILECARVRTGRLGRDIIKTTACGLKIKKVIKETDDGFEIKQKHMIQVYLVTK